MLLELTIPGAPVPFRVANYVEDIIFHGLTFVKFAFHCDEMEDPTSMSLRRWRLSAENVSSQFVSLLENYWHPDSKWMATVWFPVDMTLPNETPFASGDVLRVTQSVTDYVGGVMDLGAGGITLTKTLPGRRYTVAGGFPFLPRRF